MNKKLYYYELRVDGQQEEYQLGFSAQEELNFENAKKYAHDMGLYDNEDDQYSVLGYSVLNKDQYYEKYG
jgi:hypothetical protein